jgi:hypothetical protein
LLNVTDFVVTGRVTAFAVAPATLPVAVNEPTPTVDPVAAGVIVKAADADEAP